MDIAIIGAGMAGLSCGMKLRDAGHGVVLFDKGRGPGGRMATRRAQVDGETLHFDHGAQYFTVRDTRFREQVEQWQAAGVASPWPVAGDDAFVGTPGMNAPIRAMSQRLDVRFGVRVATVGRSGDGWRLDGEGVPETVFDAVVIAVPAEQVAPLVSAYEGELAELAENTPSDPCWTLMAAFEGMVEHGDILREEGAIGWAARNSAKPEREPAKECWVVQATPDWSREHLEQETHEVAALLLEAFSARVGSLPDAIHIAAHRWRYALSGEADHAARGGAFWDLQQQIGACGDWLVGPRIESAYLSGIELAERIIADG